VRQLSLRSNNAPAFCPGGMDEAITKPITRSERTVIELFRQPVRCYSFAVHGRCTSKTPRRDNGVTDGTSQRGGGDERHNGMPIQVVHDVPSGMEEPAEADEAVRVESLIGAIGDDSRESELPDAQPTIEIGGTRASDHDGVEVPALWFLECGCRDNEERGDDDWRQYISQVNVHGGVVPCCAAFFTPSGWSRHR
jgi:hypothetical protein